MRSVGRLSLTRRIFTPARSAYITPDRSEIFEGIDVGRSLESLREYGFASNINLPRYYVEEIYKTALNESVLIDGNISKCIKYHELVRLMDKTNVDVTQANYFNIYEKCPQIRNIARDPLINRIAKEYIGNSARHLGTSLWWSFPRSRDELKMSKAAQLFHYDLDDFRFIKFFFYITDVGPDDGPHVLVSGSHAKKPFKFILNLRRYKDEEIIKYYGEECIINITGTAGTGFVEDTFSIHKGEGPKSRARLILQLYFARSQGFCDDRLDEKCIRSEELENL
jgi:hypothetical protein